jgi:glucose/arabinose dehydrogenase
MCVHRRALERTLVRLSLAACALALGAIAPTGARAASGPPGFVVEPAFPGATYQLPVQIAFMPDGRKLVVEARGQVWVYTPSGVKLPTPFVDLNQKVMCCGGRGLLSVALDPDFASNRWVYFLYVVDPDSDAVDFDSESECFSRLERYQVSVADPNVVDLTTRQVLFGTQWSDGVPAADIYHTIGTIRFGTDKSLLVSTGDGAHFDTTDAGGLDPDQFLPGRADPYMNVGSFRSRSLSTLGGKLLRLDKETGRGLPSNPFWDGNAASIRSRIWVYGLRNPYRFCIKPGTGSTNPAAGNPGTLYIGDTGWNTFESIYVSRVGGKNYGWPCFEGPSAQSLYQAVVATASGDTNVLCSASLNAENPVQRTAPLIWWHHTDGFQSNPSGWFGRAVIGGVFQSGGNYPPPYANSFFAGDFINGWARWASVDTSDAIVANGDFVTVNASTEHIVDLECDPISGDVFYVMQGNAIDGGIFRVRYLAYPTPRAFSCRADSATGTTHHPIPGAGSPWVDLIGGHNASLINFTGAPTSGWQGDGTSTSPYRLELDGVNDRASVLPGTIASLQTLDGASAAMWFQTGSDVTREQFLLEWVSQYADPYPGMRIEIANGNLRVWTNPWADIVPVQPDTWYYVTVAKDSIDGTRVYVNGQLEYTSPNAVLGGQTSRLMIGASTYRGSSIATIGEFFGGAIGECTAWSTAITGGEALSLYQRSVALYEATASRVLAVRADSASGIGPYPVPGAFSPWFDMGGENSPTLMNFDATAASGWQGLGTIGSPYRLQFDGVNDRVTVPAGSIGALQAPGGVSAEVWFKTGVDVQTDQRVLEWLSSYASPFAGMSIGIANGNLRVLLDQWTNVVTLDPDTWYYVTVTKLSGLAKVYVNGLKKLQSTHDNLGGQVSELVMGASTASGAGQYNRYFTGAIGGVTLWRRTLLDPEVQEHYFEDADQYVKPPGLGLEVMCLRADSAAGAGPPVVPSASSPWHDLIADPDAGLANIVGDSNSGWLGNGTLTSPYRLKFDGVDDHAAVPAGSIAALQSPSAASVSLWFLTGPDVQIRNQYVFEWVGSFQPPAPGMSVAVDEGHVRLWLSPWVNLATVTPFAWYHVVVTKEADAVRAYVNGQLVYAGTKSLLAGQASEIVIGASTYLGAGVYGDAFGGAIAEVRTWPVGLTYAEATSLFQSTRSRYPGPWSTVDVDGGPTVPLGVVLRPNPFRDRVAVEFTLTRPGPARLDVYGVDGRRVRTLAQPRFAAGRQRLSWDGRDDDGHTVRQGIYFAELTTSEGTHRRRLVFLR